jgi:hypothetical protein
MRGSSGGSSLRSSAGLFENRPGSRDRPGGGPRVRIRFPPPASLVRTWLSGVARKIVGPGTRQRAKRSNDWTQKYSAIAKAIAGLPAPTINGNILHWGLALEYSTLYLTDRFTSGPPKEEPFLVCGHSSRESSVYRPNVPKSEVPGMCQFLSWCRRRYRSGIAAAAALGLMSVPIFQSETLSR